MQAYQTLSPYRIRFRYADNIQLMRVFECELPVRIATPTSSNNDRFYGRHGHAPWEQLLVFKQLYCRFSANLTMERKTIRILYA